MVLKKNVTHHTRKENEIVLKGTPTIRNRKLSKTCSVCLDHNQ